MGAFRGGVSKQDAISFFRYRAQEPFMQMPQPDQAVIDRRETICRDLCELVAADCVIDSVEG